MIEKTTYDIDVLDKRVIDMTGAELRSLIVESIVAAHKEMSSANNDVGNHHKLIRGAKTLAAQIGVSQSTVNRWIRNNVITYPAVIKEGGVTFFDMDAVHSQLAMNEKKKGGIRLRG